MRKYLHSLLARSLLLKQLLLPRNISSVALCQHILSQGCDSATNMTESGEKGHIYKTRMYTSCQSIWV